MNKPGPQKQYSETLYARLESEQKSFLLSVGDDYSDGLRRLIDYCRDNVPVAHALTLYLAQFNDDGTRPPKADMPEADS